MSRAFLFAWLSVVRQPARSLLGIAGVAAIAALLFDMLLLSRGLVVSFGELLDRSGFDVRVLASDAPPFTGPRLSDAQTLANEIATLTGIEAVLPLRVRDASVVGETAPVPAPPPGVAGAAGQLEPDSDESGGHVHFIGADPHVRSMWTVVEGHDVPDTVGSASVVVINERLARQLGLRVGSTVWLRGRCSDSSDAFPPVRFSVAGIAEFPFDSVSAATVAGTLEDVDRLCGEPRRPERRDVSRQVGTPSWRAGRRRRNPRRTPRAVRRHERGARRAVQPGGVLLLSSDLRRSWPS